MDGKKCSTRAHVFTNTGVGYWVCMGSQQEAAWDQLEQRLTQEEKRKQDTLHAALLCVMWV